MSSHDLDLDPTMPNVKLIRGLFISYNIFQGPKSFIYYLVIVLCREMHLLRVVFNTTVSLIGSILDLIKQS